MFIQYLSLFLWLILLAYSQSVNANTNPLNLQLATTYQPQESIADYWISEKLDGVRGYWDGKNLYTRRGHRINAPSFFTENWPTIRLEGELWIERGKFEQVSGIVRIKYPKDYQWQSMKFMMFDLPKHQGVFSERIEKMKSIVLTCNTPYLRMIEQYRINDNTTLLKWLDTVVTDGGEGLMLHKADAYYQQGRTANIMKLKPYFDAEAQVIAHIEGKGKYLNKLGAI